MRLSRRSIDRAAGADRSPERQIGDENRAALRAVPERFTPGPGAFRPGRPAGFSAARSLRGPLLAGFPGRHRLAARQAVAWLAACFVLLPALSLSGGLALAASVSEPSGSDLPLDTTTTGYIVVGETVTGNIVSRTDQDWYGVDLVEGRTYRFDLRSVSLGGGTLTDQFLMGLYNSGGRHFSGTNTHDGGTGLDGRLVHTATYTGMHIVSAAGSGDLGYGEGT